MSSGGAGGLRQLHLVDGVVCGGASGVPGGEERCATGVYDLPCVPMGVPRVWAIKRGHMQPLGEWATHRDGLAVVFCRRR